MSLGARRGATRYGRILLLGSAGQLGTELKRAFDHRELFALDRRAADLSRPEALRSVVREIRPALILNAAAFTAVDRAESEPSLADAVNHLAPAVLAEEAERAGALLVHYSTDYVFDGSKSGPWVETDAPAPLNAYGAGKLAGERAVASACAQHLILRTSWIYGPSGHNFLLTMLRLGREKPLLKVVNDQLGAPTSSASLADATCRIIDRLEQNETDAAKWAGIYHATCAGFTSWYGFAAAIFQSRMEMDASPWARLEGIPSADYPTPATRPANSVLSNQKLQEKFGVYLPDWDQAMAEVLTRLQVRTTTATYSSSAKNVERPA